MIDFATPWLFLILPLPVAVYFLLPPRASYGSTLLVPERVGRRLVRRTDRTNTVFSSRHILPVLIWFLLVGAACGPRQLVSTPALPTSGRDLVLALDLSGSMVREDFFLNDKRVTRLQAFKAVGARFVRRRGGDRVGLVVFGSRAYFAAPLTFDVEAVARSIEQAVIGISGRATNIGDALGIALKRLANSKAKTRVVILLSDGKNNAGAATPRGVARLAGEMGVRVHTIAFGPRDIEEAADKRGAVDAVTLQAMAALTGGQMFRVRTTDDLVAVTDALDRLEATATAGLAAEVVRDLWLYPALLAGLLCLLLAWREVR